MPDFYAYLALVTASISLVIGIFSYYVGLKRGNITYRYFAFMAFCLAVFLSLPPTGFILVDQPPYELSFLGKRIFIFLYYALFPWYIALYTGYKKVWIPRLLSFWVIITYCIMFVSDQNNSLPVWVIFAIISFVSTFVFGLVAGIFLLNTGESKAWWFITAMSIFGLLLSLTITNLFLPGSGIFFPLHTSAIPFMLIMGFHIVMDYLKKKGA